jgi:hypothetical protein
VKDLLRLKINKKAVPNEFQITLDSIIALIPKINEVSSYKDGLIVNSYYLMNRLA